MPAHAQTQPRPAMLVLEDGRTFHGTSYGAAGETFGEAVFTTGMTGYQETLTDPSYHKQVVVQTMVETGLLDWRGVADRMSVRPAAIGRLDGHGRPLAPGEPANLLLLDQGRRAVVDPAALASRSRNSPYAGRELPGRVVHTFLRGVPTVLDAKAVR